MTGLTSVKEKGRADHADLDAKEDDGCDVWTLS